MRHLIAALLLAVLPISAGAETYNETDWNASTPISVGRLNNFEAGIQQALVTGYEDLVVAGGYSSTTRVTVTADWVGVTNGTTFSMAQTVNLVLAPTASARALLGQDGTWSPSTATFYPVYLIMKIDGTTSLVTSQSWTNPDLTNATFSGYTFYRLISAFRNEAAGSYAIRPYTQAGSMVLYNAQLLASSAGSAATFSASLTPYVPTTVTTRAMLAYQNNFNSPGIIGVNVLNLLTQAGAQTYFGSATYNGDAGGAGSEAGFLEYPIQSGNLLWYSTSNNSCSVFIYVNGFAIDALRR